MGELARTGGSSSSTPSASQRGDEAPERLSPWAGRPQGGWGEWLERKDFIRSAEDGAEALRASGGLPSCHRPASVVSPVDLPLPSDTCALPGAPWGPGSVLEPFEGFLPTSGSSERRAKGGSVVVALARAWGQCTLLTIVSLCSVQCLAHSRCTARLWRLSDHVLSVF